MLWPLLEHLQWLFGVAVADRLHKVGVLSRAEGACHPMAVVAVEVQSLIRVQQQLEAIVALEKIK